MDQTQTRLVENIFENSEKVGENWEGPDGSSWKM
jgi:hypothetical protein